MNTIAGLEGKRVLVAITDYSRIGKLIPGVQFSETTPVVCKGYDEALVYLALNDQEFFLPWHMIDGIGLVKGQAGRTQAA